MKKKILTTILIVTLLISFSSMVLAAEEVTTVTFVTYQNIAKNLEVVAEEFEKNNPGIKIKIDGYPFAQMFEIIETKMQAKSKQVDILNVDAPLTANYSVKGYLEPLDKYFNDEDKNQFIESALAQGSYNGKFMAAPLNSSSVGMFINVDLFEKYGVELPSTDPAERWTWEKVVSVAKKLTLDSDNDSQVDIWGLAFDQFSQPYQMLPLPQSLGGKGISPDGLTATGYINTEPWIKATQFYQDLFSKYKVSPIGVAPFQSPELFKAGEIAMILTGPWHIGNFNSVEDLNWIYVPHPYFEEGKPVTPTGSWQIGISKYSENKEAAAKFVKFLTLKEGNKIYYQHDRNLPANSYTLAYAKEEAEKNGNNALLLSVYEAQNTAVPRPKTPGYLEWEKIMARTFEDIRNGTAPGEALDNAAQKIDRVLKKYKQ